VSKITSDELFTGKKFKIGNTGITFEWRGWRRAWRGLFARF